MGRCACSVVLSILFALPVAQAAAAAGACGGSQPLQDGSCPSNRPPADQVLLQRRQSLTNFALVNKSSKLVCPVSGGTCSKNTCCPGIPFTLGRTFPCPTSDKGFQGCDVHTEEEILDGLIGALTRRQKYTMVRGTGYDKWDALPGYYIGNSGLHLGHGIPSMNFMDNGQGFRTMTKEVINEVTGWPCALAVASSWSEADTERWAVALGEEFRAKGANVILGPGVNVHRVARGGRNAEYVSGESPYLGARLAPAWIKGVQSKGVMAVVKHFVLNSQETHRSGVNSIVDDRTLWEVYYPPFEAAVKVGVGAFMCAYNYVNGLQACNNPHTLLEDLKGTMGFEGFVQSDWWALKEFAAPAGTDQEMPGDMTNYFTDKNLRKLSAAKLDDMVRRQLRMIYRIGLYEHPPCQPPACKTAMYNNTATTPAHQRLNRELATKAVTLLKNDGAVLPLSAAGTNRIVMVGPACNASQDEDRQLGWWTRSSYYNLGGSGRVIAANVTTIHDRVRMRCKGSCELFYYSGNISTAAISFIKAMKPTVVLMCGGASTTEDKDRDSLSIDDEAFLSDVAEGVQGVPKVSLTISPGVILMPWIDDVDAALNLFLAGTHTGDAFADVLFGIANPSAKLPVTFPKSEADTVAPCLVDHCPYTEKLMVGFHGLEDTPVNFPFGHGLSYTRFKYSHLTVSTKGVDMPNGCDGAVACVSVAIENVGDVAGVEVAQLYLGFPKSAGEPPKLLRGFVRTDELKPGGIVSANFPLHSRDLQIYGGKSTGWTTVDGDFRVLVGSSSRDIRVTSTFASCKGKVSAASAGDACP